MKAKLLLPQDVLIDPQDRSKGRARRPIGWILDHPGAFRLVQHGSAEPADDECRKACGLTDEEMEYAQTSHRRTAAGIQPEDYAAFDAGLMIGYDPTTGKPLPGPNAEQEEEDLEFDEDETDDFDDEAEVATTDEGTQ